MSETQWENLLDKSPGDVDLRRAYATWLQDEVDDVRRADFQRWLASEEKWPTNKPLNREEVGWAWYWSQEPITDPARHATLAPWALSHMPRIRWLYATRRAAEDALYQAWLSWQGETKIAQA